MGQQTNKKAARDLMGKLDETFGFLGWCLAHLEKEKNAFQDNFEDFQGRKPVQIDDFDDYIELG